MTVISLIEEPFAIEGGLSDYPTFSKYTFMNGTLYVPEGTSGGYKATDGWMDFENIVEGRKRDTSKSQTRHVNFAKTTRRRRQSHT